MTFKRNANFDDPDTPQNSVNEKEAPSPLRNKGTMDDQVPKDWTRTEDICSLSDWLNSNKEPETEEEKRDPSNSDKDAGERYNVRSLRDETKKEDSPSLETLEETVLELKKNLDEGEKKVHDDSKTADSGRGNTVIDIRFSTFSAVDSRWWETSGPDVFDVKKNEPSPGDLDDKNAQPKVWRTKRTEVNNEDGNPKLFHRAGFGEPYLEEKTLKELHDRKRRSKGTPSDEKRYLNEVRDKNNVQHGEKNSMITLEEPNYNNAANDLQEGTLSNNVDDVSKKIPNGWNVDGNRDAKENDEQSESSRGKPNETEKKLTKYEEKGENLEGDSLGTFGIATNELQPVSTETFVSTDGKEEAADTRMQKTEEQQENVGTSKGEQVIKVSEPQGRLYENSERTKEVQRIEADDEERGKLSQQLSEGKRSAKGESGNINILLKSEKKNLIKINNENSLGNEQRPFVVNRFDVKKKLVVENEEKPGKSVSMIFKVKVEKKDSEERVNVGTRDSRFDADVFDLGKNKPNEEPYKDAVGFTNDLKQRNVDEERLKNSAEFDKGPAQRNEGPRNWYEGVAGDQTNLEQGAPKKCKEERDKFRNEEERFRDDKKKGESNDGAGSKDASASILDDNLKDSQGDNRKKYKEVFILTDGVGERKMNDKYVQRRILQYMEYSNDDVEDADSNYSDREEEEENRQDGAAEKSGVPRQRKQRSPQTGRANPVKAKLNVLIKEKLDKKKKSERRYKRKRRNPVDIIQYYDYDNDVQEQDGDPLSAVSEEERAGNNYEQNNPDESNAVIGNIACTSKSL
ncbi:uncharacterized protein LOC122403384 [Colletes gigas]|uniref:uncharacterized protein LOC122403384 n=1 Tax=Colletes gigas TaxID=935657 RepID=UPI001C9AFDA0|nr:uncharacterized protein LOC122403384 [Colletes gigas]